MTIYPLPLTLSNSVLGYLAYNDDPDALWPVLEEAVLMPGELAYLEPEEFARSRPSRRGFFLPVPSESPYIASVSPGPINPEGVASEGRGLLEAFGSAWALVLDENGEVWLMQAVDGYGEPWHAGSPRGARSWIKRRAVDFLPEGECVSHTSFTFLSSGVPLVAYSDCKGTIKVVIRTASLPQTIASFKGYDPSVLNLALVGASEDILLFYISEDMRKILKRKLSDRFLSEEVVLEVDREIRNFYLGLLPNRYVLLLQQEDDTLPRLVYSSDYFPFSLWQEAPLSLSLSPNEGLEVLKKVEEKEEEQGEGFDFSLSSFEEGSIIGMLREENTGGEEGISIVASFSSEAIFSGIVLNYTDGDEGDDIGASVSAPREVFLKEIMHTYRPRLPLDAVTLSVNAPELVLLEKV